MSTTYVDGTTPLDAVHMNALQQKVEKGQANGYASLDGTTKVPNAQLPGAGAIPTVVNGQWLKGVGGAAVWTALGPADLPAMVGYGTSFPASPVDGQEFVLVDTLSGTPSYVWRFRYNAGRGRPWEFIGGHPLVIQIGVLGPVEYTSATGYTNLATVGPQFTVPRVGDYEINYGACCVQGTGNANMGGMGLWVTGPGVVMEANVAMPTGTQGQGISASATHIRGGMTTGDVISCLYKVLTGGQQMGWFNRYLSVRPRILS
jgi:hypothetical protein